ncbi:TPA: hypothetical protein DIC20_01205 [Candidatus Dependentiae bacterium]|nr:MAG: Holliday junction ATP-dependent DNA helicase RuvA [candidate division TM6 bacterium GW2011_GWF2_36_131]KKQ03584.1 MAG: Holliday junction ATP-dependent DNA helicase RuvA [candidate division TM6 bacterium GW2011_GWE2_36_25]KKQ20139.1 MAG: Holliday junction ATP-dependent DNA helicase RuvA [candidate division TM6 bacterium GW2011_GWA2_36_9]HBR70682.1 hypothetical protein [Candidatus Dependentiae bacterium]HCU00302.1 hypothetical protein [Candidatus Dependentiae bacterium]
MLDYIKGKVHAIHEQSLSVFSEMLQLGFAINIAHPSSFSLGEEISLYLHLHWNQEQGPSLYGFKSVRERELFVLVNSCSGIGPKMSLNILSQIEVSIFINAIRSSDVKSLSQLKGIGTKKAEQLILQLKSKIDHFICSDQQLCVGAVKHLKQVTDVLESLNYSRTEIQQTLIYLREQPDVAEISFDQIMRHALSFLAKKM